jgi:hypothetical protein
MGTTWGWGLAVGWVGMTSPDDMDGYSLRE